MTSLVKKPFFDTLHYFQQLKAVKIPNAETFTRALSSALKQNIFSKEEIKEMLAEVLKESRENFDKMLQEAREKNHAFEKKMARERAAREKKMAEEIAVREKTVTEERAAREKAMEQDRAKHTEALLKAEVNFQKAMTRNLVTTISVLGTLIVVMGTIATLGHHLV